MKILVTGCAGFIGSHVAEALLKRGDIIIGIDNINDYYDPKIKEDNLKILKNFDSFTFYKIDITDNSALKDLFSKNKIEKVVHLAARAGVRASIENPKLYFDVNVIGTKNLLDLSVKYKIKNFVFGSSSSVYGSNKKTPFSEDDPINNIISPYAETKKQGEIICKGYHDKFGLNITCLRFFTVYGERGRPDMVIYKFTKMMLAKEPIPIYGNGNTERDYTYIADIVFGIIAALDKNLGFEIINLGDSNPIKLKKLIGLIEDNLNVKAKLKEMPPQEGDVDVTYADISKARRLLGYEPKVKIEKGIANFTRWYKEK